MTSVHQVVQRELKETLARIRAACESLPALPDNVNLDVPSDPWRHDSCSSKLPSWASIRDRWIHGLAHEIVS